MIVQAFVDRGGNGLFDLRFLIQHVFAHDGVKFIALHFFRMIALIFCRRVVMAGPSRGYEFNFVCHDGVLRLAG